MTTIFRKLTLVYPSKSNLIRKICDAKRAPLYRLRIARPRDYERVMFFMMDTYFKSEPSIVNVGGLAGKPIPTLVHLMHKSMKEGMTIIAEDVDNCVVGAAINALSRPDDVEEYIKLAECCETGPARDLIRFYAFCSRQADLWTTYCVQNIFECVHVAVHPDHQGQGIAKRLIMESWVLARDVAFRLFRIDCSSRYTARIAEGFGWTCQYSIPYRRYFDRGQFVFKCIQMPHTEFKIYVDFLNNYKSYYPPEKRR